MNYFERTKFESLTLTMKVKNGDDFDENWQTNLTC